MRSLLPAPARVHAFVEASLRAMADGDARVELMQLLNEGAAACPRCSALLDVTGYRRTETSYMVEEVLRCGGCGGELLLRREDRA